MDAMSAARVPTPAPSGLARLVLSLFAALAVLTVSVGLAAPASAHADLVSVSPEDGSSLTAAPPEVTLTFSDTINTEFAKVTVNAEDGTSVTSGAPSVDGAVVTQRLVSSMGGGTYTVAYRVVSEDGHPVSGSSTFSVDSPGPEGEVASTPPSGSRTKSATSTVGTSSTSTGTGGTDSVSSSSSAAAGTSASSTTPSVTDTEATSATGDGGPSPVLWTLLGILGVAAIAGLVTFLLRRRGGEHVGG